jgi:hypothetical protein
VLLLVVVPLVEPGCPRIAFDRLIDLAGKDVGDFEAITYTKELLVEKDAVHPYYDRHLGPTMIADFSNYVADHLGNVVFVVAVGIPAAKDRIGHNVLPDHLRG